MTIIDNYPCSTADYDTSISNSNQQYRTQQFLVVMGFVQQVRNESELLRVKLLGLGFLQGCYQLIKSHSTTAMVAPAQRIGAGNNLAHFQKTVTAPASSSEPVQDCDFGTFPDLVLGSLAELRRLDKNAIAKFFNKKDRAICVEIEHCLSLIKQLDDDCLAKALHNKLDDYPKNKIAEQCQLAYAAAEAMKITQERMKELEPKARQHFAVRWSHIISTILTAAIAGAIYLLPALGLQLFIGGALGNAVLQHLSREGTLMFNISGIFLNIYQLITNKNDNIAQEEWQGLMGHFSRVSGALNKSKEDFEMLASVMSRVEQMHVEVREDIKQVQAELQTEIQKNIANVENSQAEIIARQNQEATERLNRAEQRQNQTDIIIKQMQDFMMRMSPNGVHNDGLGGGDLSTAK